MGDTVRDKYIQYKTDPDNDGKADSYFCTMHGISLDELRELKTNDKKLSRDILYARREKYAKRMTKIDEALFTAAESGDTKAAELLYRRFDGWDPKLVQETNNYFNFNELLKAARSAKIIKRPL